jgi:hypothetical protein
MLAAQGIVVSLSVTIESPIINLLATSTALTEDRWSYLLLRKFTIHWMIFLTIVTALLGFTPLFDLVVVRLMGIPGEVAYWVRIGLRIMLFWSAAIAWRRFLQGVMIRFNQTRKVAWGTAVRLMASAGAVVAMVALTDLPGVVIGSSALMVGVIAEALYATAAVQPILRENLGPDSPLQSVQSLTYRELFGFHLPLAATSLLILLVQPMVSLSLSRSRSPTLALAAWSVVFQFMLVMRSPAFALPEVVIALTDGERTFSPLRRFTLSLVGINSLVMVVLVLTPLISIYLSGIQDTTEEIAAIARFGILLFIPLPALAIMISWIRGLLIDGRVTRVVNAGMVANLIVTAAILILGVQLQWPGINTAAVALTIAAAVELVYLWWRVGQVLEFPFKVVDLSQRAATG